MIIALLHNSSHTLVCHNHYKENFKRLVQQPVRWYRISGRVVQLNRAVCHERPLFTENNKFWSRNLHRLVPYRLASLWFLHTLGDIEQKPQGKIRVISGLVLIQRETPINQEGNVILHCHIDGVLQCIDFQKFRICIVFSSHRVIQLQQIVLILKSIIKTVDLNVRFTVTVFSFAIDNPPLGVVQRGFSYSDGRQFATGYPHLETSLLLLNGNKSIEIFLNVIRTFDGLNASENKNMLETFNALRVFSIQESIMPEKRWQQL